jgi:hypothetical protein
MMLIDFQKTDLDLNEKLLDIFSVSLDWVYADQLFSPEAFVGGLNKNIYNVDVHAVCMQLQLWKSTHILNEQHAGQPLPACGYIAPTGIAY